MLRTLLSFHIKIAHPEPMRIVVLTIDGHFTKTKCLCLLRRPRQVYDEYGLDGLEAFARSEVTSQSLGMPLKRPAEVGRRQSCSSCFVLCGRGVRPFGWRGSGVVVVGLDNRWNGCAPYGTGPQRRGWTTLSATVARRRHNGHI